MIHVLFVCLGNICRSPMAEAVFRDMVAKENLSDRIAVDSAGTSGWHVGERPHAGTLNILKTHGIPSDGLYGRRLTREDFDRFDYIVGMDRDNVADIRRITRQPDHPKIFRLLDLTESPKDVPDPYYTGNFRETYDLVTVGCRALLEKIKRDHRLTPT
jgi:protein-tyrosine phosphatase